MGSVNVSQAINSRGVSATISWTTGPTVDVEITGNAGYGAQAGWKIRGVGSDTTVYLDATNELNITSGSFDAVDGKEYAFQAVWGGVSDGAIFTVNFDSSSSGGGSSGGSGTQLSIYINQGEGTELQVIRTWNEGVGSGDNTRMSNGDWVNYKDYFDIACAALDGYELNYYTVNGSTLGYTYTNLSPTEPLNSGYDHYGLLVEANPTVTSSATPKRYTLSTSLDPGAVVTISRISSKNSNASVGEITAEDAIYHYDTLRIVFESEVGYNIDKCTVAMSNGTVTINSGYEFTVTGDVLVTATAAVKSYNLQLNQGTGSLITVTRTESPLQGASIDVSLVNNDAIYYGDILRISFTAEPGYDIVSQKVNGINAESGDTWEVDDDGIQVETITELMGLAHIYNGTSFDSYLVYICDNNNKEFNQYIPYIYNGTSWDIYS